jgi:serine/threonine protein kinase
MKDPVRFRSTFSEYRAAEIIAEGGSGRIYKATDEDGKTVAVKLLDPKRSTREKIKRFKNELTFGLRNKHPNVITVLDHGLYESAGVSSPFYVMTFFPRSLRNMIAEGIEPSRVLSLFVQILDGVEAAHLSQVIHRDLKPENILCDPNTFALVVADFGIARFHEEELFTTVETKPASRLANFAYAAPEQRRSGLSVDQRADVYALGLILNEMFTSEIPQGTGYKTIGSIAPDLGYLDDLVVNMIQQSASGRPASIEIVKQKLVGLKAQHISFQRMSALKEAVVPTTDLDDPLINDPPRLVSFDWNKGTLTLILNVSVTDFWVQALQNMGSHTALLGKGPEQFSFSGNQATIPARENEVQPIIDHFKNWLPVANRVFELNLRRVKEAAEDEKRRQLQRMQEEEERRLRVLKNTRI